MWYGLLKQRSSTSIGSCLENDKSTYSVLFDLYIKLKCRLKKKKKML